MILADHNGYLTAINANAGNIPADPVLGGQEPPDPGLKWKGQCQAHLQDTVIQEVRGSGAAENLVAVKATLVTLPSNIPVEIGQGDVLTIKKTGALSSPKGTQLYQVRERDETAWSFGHFRYTCMAI